MTLDLYPAVDLRHGKVVRLSQGDPARATVYADTPPVADFVAQGASCLHVVNLDGSFAGEAAQSTNAQVIETILNDFPQLRVQVAGGIRSYEAAARALALGAARVVLGTMAVKDPTETLRVIHAFPQQVVIGIDHLQGDVKTDGWQQSGGVAVEALVARYEAAPVAGFLMTDIARDGMLNSPDIETATRVKAQHPWARLIASGGIARLEDFDALMAATIPSGASVYHEAIVGRAIYSGAFTVADALARIRALGSEA